MAFELDDAARLFADALTSARNDLQAIKRKSQDELLLQFNDGDSITFFLGNLLAEMNTDTGAAAEKLQRYIEAISNIRAQSAASSKAFDESMLIPMIRNNDYVSQLCAAATESTFDGERYYFRNIAADYWAILAIDSETCTTPLRRSMLREDADIDFLFAKSVENFQGRILPTLKVEDLGPIKMLSGSGDYEASLLAVDDFWLRTAEAEGGSLLAVALSKDILLYCSKSNDDAVVRLRDVVAKRNGTFAYSISNEILEWTEAGWIVASV